MKQLSSEVSNLKAMVLSICDKVPQAECPSTTPPAAADCSHSAPPPASSRHRSNPANNMQDRKFNVVVFGVQEMPSGSSRFARNKHDFSKLSAIFSDLERDTDHASSIRDSRRLGKYVKDILQSSSIGHP